MSQEQQTDILIVGGGTGGVAAALAALKLGRRVTLVETTDWLGGQLTAQAVPPDENPWIDQEGVGGTASYRQFREQVRAYYRQHYPLTAAAKAEPWLNPGQGNVSPLCHEPRVALAVIEAMLAPFRSNGQLCVLLQHHAVEVAVDGDQVRAVCLVSQETHERIWVSAPYVIDATEWGDLLPLAGVEHIIGAESQAQTGELHALPGDPNPLDQQAVSACFALDHLPEEDHTIVRPAMYDFWRDYQAPFWPDRQLSWTAPDPETLTPVYRPLFIGATDTPHGADLWHFRRIVYRHHFARGFYPSDIIAVNWPQIDYWLGPLLGGSPEESAQHAEAARQLSLSLVYWMQTEAPRPEGGYGYPGLRLRGDLLGTNDGLAKHLYVRESRRILAEFTVLEQHVGVEARGSLQGAARFDDSVGIGSYRIDLHPSTSGRTYVDIATWPFQIPLGALVPQRIENLLPGGKNLGVTHITNGCYRLHPVEWNIGEAAGALAAYCLDQHLTPRAVCHRESSLRDFQTLISEQLGIALAWPEALRVQQRIKLDPLGI